MSDVPILKPQEVVRILENLGFVEDVILKEIPLKRQSRILQKQLNYIWKV
jgi:hypothetical protein